jgi:MoaA/NifB/PqqE/SkfB family radical SAM enzyme
MLEFCEKRGVLLHAQAIMFGKDPFDENAKDLELSSNQIRDLHNKLADWKTQRRGLMFTASTYRRSVAWQEYPALTKRGRAPSSCMAGRFYVHIEANGDAWPCGHFGGDFQPMNVIRDGLEDALLHTKVHNCEDCAVAYLNERKSVFALRPSAVMEVLRRG